MVDEYHKSGYNNEKFKTMSVQLKRLKTQHVNPIDDNIVHFIHKDKVTKCLFFSFFYYLMMRDRHDNEALFPSWKDLVKLDTNGTDSQVSKQFKKMWSHLYKIAMNYAENLDGLTDEEKETIKLYCFETLSKDLGIHCAKKKGVQDLGDSELVPQVSFQ